MIELIKEHWVISVIGTIFLGALGSGLWDAALKPVFQYLGKYIFSILTFGAKRASDNIYIEAARSHHEAPSIKIYFIITMLLLGTLFGIETILVKKVYIDDEPIIEITECKKMESDSEIKDCVKAKFREKISNDLPFLILISIFMAVVIFYATIEMSRINRIVTYFHQCLKICLPHISDADAKIFEQKFSLMREKKDFIELIEKFKLVAEDNEITLPKSYL